MVGGKVGLWLDARLNDDWRKGRLMAGSEYGWRTRKQRSNSGNQPQDLIAVAGNTDVVLMTG